MNEHHHSNHQSSSSSSASGLTSHPSNGYAQYHHHNDNNNPSQQQQQAINRNMNGNNSTRGVPALNDSNNNPLGEQDCKTEVDNAHHSITMDLGGPDDGGEAHSLEEAQSYINEGTFGVNHPRMFV